MDGLLIHHGIDYNWYYDSRPFLFKMTHMVHVDVECGKFQRCLGGGSRQHAPTTESGGNPTDQPAVGDRKEWKSKEFFFSP